ncbi:Transmembrane_domain-containing protein [Hexamita inflata]|uniref:Transmembrane domain-containing protein n=1 Tax=Hexamita inflata TaxID=28002 RepID=A0AA86Q9S3_9EUKA|nr:Transmembrane domain-containing protein [Hexamita inflata]
MYSMSSITIQYCIYNIYQLRFSAKFVIALLLNLIAFLVNILYFQTLTHNAYLFSQAPLRICISTLLCLVEFYPGSTNQFESISTIQFGLFSKAICDQMIYYYNQADAHSESSVKLLQLHSVMEDFRLVQGAVQSIANQYYFKCVYLSILFLLVAKYSYKPSTAHGKQNGSVVYLMCMRQIFISGIFIVILLNDQVTEQPLMLNLRDLFFIVLNIRQNYYIRLFISQCVKYFIVTLVLLTFKLLIFLFSQKHFNAHLVTAFNRKSYHFYIFAIFMCSLQCIPLFTLFCGSFIFILTIFEVFRGYVNSFFIQRTNAYVSDSDRCVALNHIQLLISSSFFQSLNGFTLREFNSVQVVGLIAQLSDAFANIIPALYQYICKEQVLQWANIFEFQYLIHPLQPQQLTLNNNINQIQQTQTSQFDVEESLRQTAQESRIEFKNKGTSVQLKKTQLQESLKHRSIIGTFSCIICFILLSYQFVKTQRRCFNLSSFAIGLLEAVCFNDNLLLAVGFCLGCMLEEHAGWCM